MLILNVLQIRFRVVLKIQNLFFYEKYQKHTPSGYCLLGKADDSINCEMEPFIYSKQGEEDNASENFV